MSNTMPFKLITPKAVVFEGAAELVIAVTTEGEEGILPQHAPFLGVLKPGVLRANVIRENATTRLEMATGKGFMQALPDGVTLLVDEAVGFDDIDVAAVRAQLEQATARQQAAGTDIAAYVREQVVIDFAAAKLRLTGH